MSQQFPVSDWCRDGLLGARWEKMLAMNWESGSPKGTDAPRDTLRLASFGLLLQKWFMMTPECSCLKTSCSLLAPLRIWKIHHIYRWCFHISSHGFLWISHGARADLSSQWLPFSPESDLRASMAIRNWEIRWILRWIAKLLGGLEYLEYDFPFIGNVIIPTD